MEYTLSEKFEVLVAQGMLLVSAINVRWPGFFKTVYEILFVECSPSLLLRPIELRDRSYSRFWQVAAPGYEFYGAPDICEATPYAGLPAILQSVKGRIMEIGPGTGPFLPYFNPENVSAIYGAELTVDFHAALEEGAYVHDLENEYHILHCSGERKSLLPALVNVGLLQEENPEPIFDYVICFRVLCGVPDLEKTLETLYALLRPGGKIIICEHIVNHWRSPKGSLLGRSVQVLFTLCGWPYFMGGCKLDRNTVNLLKVIGNINGGWEAVELDFKLEWSAIPFATGTFMKKGGNQGGTLMYTQTGNVS